MSQAALARLSQPPALPWQFSVRADVIEDGAIRLLDLQMKVALVVCDDQVANLRIEEQHRRRILCGLPRQALSG